MTPLKERLLQAPRPDSIIIWLYNDAPKRLLSGLAAGTITLEHASLDNYPHAHTADHIRGILADTGMLPSRNTQLANYDRWTKNQLATLTNNKDDEKTLQQSAIWHLRARLHKHGEQLRPSQINNATQQVRVAAQFLAWLQHRSQNLASCSQQDLDNWLSEPPTTHWTVRPFIIWANKTNQTKQQLKIPPRKAQHSPILDQDTRLELLKRTLQPDAGPLDARVAAMLLLLLAQSFHKIAQLRTTDIAVGEQFTIRLGDTPTPLPNPFAALIQELLAHRPNLNTATNPTSPWLFPGRQAGTHKTADGLRTQVTKMGINILSARNATLRQLVLDCPPPVIADALGYTHNTTDRHATQAGSPWTTYTANRTHSDQPT